MRAVESFLITLIVVVTASYAVRAPSPQISLRCARDVSVVAAWVTLHSSRAGEILLFSERANATLHPGPQYCVAPAVLWVNGTPRLYTVGWKP